MEIAQRSQHVLTIGRQKPISSSSPPPDSYSKEKLLKRMNNCGQKQFDYQHQPGPNNYSWRSRCGKRLLLAMATICHIDIFMPEPNKEPEVDLTLKSSWNNGRSGRGAKKAIQVSSACLFAWCGAKVLIVAACQALYDYHLNQIRVLGENNAPGTTSNRSSRLLELDSLVKEDIGRLKSIGAPHLQLNFISTGIYFCLVCFLSLGPQCSTYFQLINRFNFTFFLMMVDPKRAQRDLNELIVEEVDNLIHSSHNYVKNSNLLLDTISSYPSGRPFHGRRRQLAPQSGEQRLKKLKADHQSLIDLLQAKALSGRLQPTNRLPEWLEKLELQMLIMIMVYQGYCTIIQYIFVIDLPNTHLPEQLASWSWRDFQVLAEVYVALLGVAIFSGFVCVLTSMSQLDQIYATTKLKKTVDTCRYLNQLRFRGHLQQQQHQNGIETGNGSKSRANQFQLKSSMNADLLHVILHYKILLGQLRPIQRAHGYLASTFLQYPIFALITARVFVPYLTDGVYLPLAMAIPVGLLLWVDLCIVLMCYLHSRGQDLYRSLASLVAHTVRLESVPLGRGLYHRQTLQVLRKELSNPAHLVHQFAAHNYGLQFTYTTLIKIHFWFGLVLISIYNSPNTHRQASLRASFNLL